MLDIETRFAGSGYIDLLSFDFVNVVVVHGHRLGHTETTEGRDLYKKDLHFRQPADGFRALTNIS